MAGYVPLPAYNPGRGVDFSPINNALLSYVDQKNKNALLGLQTRQADQADKRLGIEQGQFDIQKQNNAYQMVQRFGQAATAVDQMTDPAQRAAAWKSVVARHGTDGLTPEELDPITGPKLMAAQAGQFLDPRDSQAKDLELQYKRAQIGKLNAEAANGGEAFGKTGTVVQGNDGRFYTVQFGAHGQRKIEPLEVGAQPAPTAAPGSPTTPGAAPQPSAQPVPLTPSRGVEVVGDTIIDKATGAPVRNVAGNIAGGEQAKVVGRETGQGQMGLPKAATALKQYEEQSKVVTGAIDKAISQADGWTTGLTGSAMSTVPGTKAFDLKNTLNTIKANIGFDKLQDMRENSPTGGALGQVSEMENILLQSVWGSIEQAQSKEQLVENLNKIKAIRERFTTLKQQAYQQDVARFGAANVPDPETGKLPAHASDEAAPQSNVPRPSSKAERDALPPGTRYMAPDGSMRVRQ